MAFTTKISILILIWTLVNPIESSNTTRCYVCEKDDCKTSPQTADCDSGLCEDVLMKYPVIGVGPSRGCVRKGQSSKEGCGEYAGGEILICFCVKDLCNNGSASGMDKFKKKIDAKKGSSSKMRAVASPVIVNGGALFMIGCYLIMNIYE